MHRGYIKSWRKLIEWGWYKDSHTFHIFHYLLSTANYKESEFMGHKIMPGQAVTGLHSLSVNTGISIQSIRTCLARLKPTNEITIKSTNKFSIITIINWAHYQSDEKELNRQINKQTNNPLTINQQTTNNILELKNVKNKDKRYIIPDDFILSDKMKEYAHLKGIVTGKRKKGYVETGRAFFHEDNK